MIMKLFQSVILGVLLLSRLPAVLAEEVSLEILRAEAEARFGSEKPHLWSENVPGVHQRLTVPGKTAALTLDACGSDGDGYDKDLIEFLRSRNIPATLFINARWIDKNPEVFKSLAADPLFEIENHGTLHRPASVAGNSVYGLTGTRNAAELVDEIEINGRKIEALTGRKPRFYRSGTAYYDEAAVGIVRFLGYEAAGFDVLGDKGATYSRGQVKEALLKTPEGGIIILHMNHPEKETAEGLREALPELQRRGFRFIKLEEGLPLKPAV